MYSTSAGLMSNLRTHHQCCLKSHCSFPYLNSQSDWTSTRIWCDQSRQNVSFKVLSHRRLSGLVMIRPQKHSKVQKPSRSHLVMEDKWDCKLAISSLQLSLYPSPPLLSSHFNAFSKALYNKHSTSVENTQGPIHLCTTVRSATELPWC